MRSDYSEPLEHTMEQHPNFYHEDLEDLAKESQYAEETSDDDDDESDTEYDQEETPWSLIIKQAKARHRHHYYALVNDLVNAGTSENERKGNAFHQI